MNFVQVGNRNRHQVSIVLMGYKIQIYIGQASRIMVSISDSIDQLSLSYKLSIETVLEKSINDEKPMHTT